jgi:D-alanyl-lipoteichoic acid acyltransferase DltB (MBOAT superfamily)
MYFNSFAFAIFFIIVFFIYWFVLKRKIGLQNIFILIASYVFYGWWDWRFLSLIAFSTLVDFFLALKITKIENRGRRKLFKDSRKKTRPNQRGNNNKGKSGR